MLTEQDIAFIKANRSEILANRTEPVTLVHTIPGAEDPWTGESTVEGFSEVVDAVWSESTGKNERDYFGGIVLLENDVVVSFEPTVNLTDVEHVIRQNKTYELVAIDERGIGEINRYETVARLVK
jgi:hypothetical protein